MWSPGLVTEGIRDHILVPRYVIYEYHQMKTAVSYQNKVSQAGVTRNYVQQSSSETRHDWLKQPVSALTSLELDLTYLSYTFVLSLFQGSPEKNQEILGQSPKHGLMIARRHYWRLVCFWLNLNTNWGFNEKWQASWARSKTIPSTLGKTSEIRIFLSHPSDGLKCHARDLSSLK
jgi:hypothetical protein